jgi:tetratricopeptide (TPR) repeat protein
MDHPTKSGSKFGFLGVGILLGLGLSILLGWQLLIRRSQALIQLIPSSATITETPFSTPTPEIPTPTPAPTAINPAESILLNAEIAIGQSDLGTARELLLPLIELNLSEVQAARLYGDLAYIEYGQGNYRLACGYLENQYAHERKPDVLFMLASVCRDSGLLVKAAGYYQELIGWEGSEADVYRQDAQYALLYINYLLGTPEPTPHNP